jgi:hypothetical protein
MRKFLENIELFWSALPKEVRVALYITASYILSQVIIMLGKVQVNSELLTFGINVLLVFLGQIKPRMDVKREEQEILDFEDEEEL